MIRLVLGLLLCYGAVGSDEFGGYHLLMAVTGLVLMLWFVISLETIDQTRSR